MISFDKNTLHDWNTRGVTDISCFLIEGGCAGNKLQILEISLPECDYVFSLVGSIRIHIKKSEENFFHDIRVTKSGSKWIVTSDSINIHCGCGSSFMTKSGNPIIDKARKMKEIIRQKKEKSHT